jgi:hypothetical protein
MLLHNFEHWQCLYFIMMTKVFRNILLILLATSIGFLACKKDVAIPDSSRGNDVLDISFKVPQGWPSPYYSFVNNQLTNAGFKLGRNYSTIHVYRVTTPSLVVLVINPLLLLLMPIMM